MSGAEVRQKKEDLWMVKRNVLKEKLASGGTSFGTMIFEFLSPGLPSLAVNAGAEFLIYDMEHSAVGLESIGRQMALCRGAGIVPIVRPPAALKHLICPLLDAGAMGVKIPSVENAKEAERVVRWTRYPPEGDRGAAFGLPHDGYLGGNQVETMRAANEDIIILAQIETQRGLDNVDEIMAVPGVDLAWLGHFDLTNSMGIPGEFKHPRFLDALDRIVAAAEKHGKTAGFLAGNADIGRAWMARGFRAILVSRDTMLFTAALRDGIGELKRPG
jgi:2-keto-3-deoxy-L-rhamnonate aldolase RhmA